MKTAETEVVRHRVDLIDPSPYQVRERFRDEGLEELGQSILEHGIIQPLVARRHPTDPVRLELIAGERRLRAARLKGVETVPVLVRELGDRAAQEIVLIENLQREDLTVSEEAHGYQKALELRDEGGQPVYTQQSLATKIGKTLSHIRDRLKLLVCPAVLIEAVETGEVALSVAMLVGRVPEAKAREAAAKQVLKPEIQEVPLNYVQTRLMLREKFMVSLSSPGFDVEDPELLPVQLSESGERLLGGSCMDCPFRSGNCVELDEEPAAEAKRKGGRPAGVDPNLCTLPSCHKRKQDAAWRIVRARAEEQNVKVVEGDAARDLFSGHGDGKVRWDAPYVELNTKPGYHDLGELSYDNTKTWRSLVRGSDAAVVVARHPLTGKRVELVEKKAAVVIAKARLRQLDEKEVLAAEERQQVEAKTARKDELRRERLDALEMREGMTDLLEAIQRQGLGVDEHRALCEMALDSSGADGLQVMGKWLGVKAAKGQSGGWAMKTPVLQHIQERAETPAALLAYTVLALISKSLRYSGHRDEDLLNWYRLFGILPKNLRRRAEALLNVGKGGKPAAKEAKVCTPQEMVKDWQAGPPTDGAESEEAVTVVQDETEVERQAAELNAGLRKMADIIGKKPKEAEDLKKWNAARLRLLRAQKRLSAAA